MRCLWCDHRSASHDDDYESGPNCSECKEEGTRCGTEKKQFSEGK